MGCVRRLVAQSLIRLDRTQRMVKVAARLIEDGNIIANSVATSAIGHIMPDMRRASNSANCGVTDVIAADMA
jgi:hypothetical protein